MSNCNAWDQQSQRQINVKECFAYHDGNGLSLLLIHALKGGTIRFAKIQLAEGLGLFLNVVRHSQICRRKPSKSSGRDICRFFGMESLIWQARLPVTRSDNFIESNVLKEA